MFFITEEIFVIFSPLHLKSGYNYIQKVHKNVTSPSLRHPEKAHHSVLERADSVHCVVLHLHLYTQHHWYDREGSARDTSITFLTRNMQQIPVEFTKMVSFDQFML